MAFAMESPLHLFLRGDLVYSSKSPEFPPFSIYAAERDFVPEDTASLCWALDAFPHIAFMPGCPQLDGPIFGRLANIHIVADRPQGSTTKWKLTESSQQSWYSLETGLRWMAAVLLEPHSTSLEFAPFPLPSSFGYLRSHKSKSIAERCVRQSRDAFVQLASMCSFAIALNSPGPGEINPAWVRTLHTKGFHPAWVENFRSTQFGDFLNTQRVGAVVHPHCRWLFQVPMMMQANVPLWFFWGEGDQDLYEQRIGGFTVRPFRPTLDQIAALRAAQKIRASNLEDRQQERTAHPMHQELNGQLPRETIQEYFQRQEQVYHNIVVKETDEVRRRRRDREHAALCKGFPGNNGPRVFEWSEFDGVPLRMEVPQHRAAGTWAMYSKTQRRYDSIRNEWDLCHAFAPGGLDESDGDCEEACFLSTPTLEPPPPSNHHWEDDLALGYRDYQTPGLDILVANPSLDDVLYYRYGFTPSCGYTVSQPDIQYPISDIKTVFGHRNAFIRTSDHIPAISEFYHTLLHNLPIPPELCDIFQQHEHPLSGRLLSSSITVGVKIVSEARYYVLEPRNPPPVDATWQVVVGDPVTAVQCYRENWAGSRLGLARVLLSKGIPFSTRAVLPALTPDPVAYNFLGLGRRPDSHKPDRFDYIEYEERLAIFLQRPHARAALLKGGLIWRLAKEVRGGMGDNNALTGPSEYVRQFGDYLHLDTTQPGLWDDGLSEDELHFICGLYKVYTGSGNQTKDLSWWPKHETWEKSPLNVGYWSPNCEEWFLQRLGAIRSGSRRGQPMNASAWGKALKKWSRTPKLIHTSKAAAAAFLELH